MNFKTFDIVCKKCNSKDCDISISYYEKTENATYYDIEATCNKCGNEEETQ